MAASLLKTQLTSRWGAEFVITSRHRKLATCILKSTYVYLADCKASNVTVYHTYRDTTFVLLQG